MSPASAVISEGDCATSSSNIATLASLVVVAAKLDTVADTTKATVGERSASDIVSVVALVSTAVERLAVTAADLLLVGWGLARLDRLGARVVLGWATAGHGKSASGESKKGNSEKLHVEDCKDVCLERVLKGRAEDVVE